MTEESSTADAESIVAWGKETPINKFFATFTLAVLLATHLIAIAVGAERIPGSLLATVDQLLARDMIQQA